MGRKSLSLIVLLAVFYLPHQARSDGPPCGLLDDPVKRGIMSATFETNLMRLCGEALPSRGFDSGAVPFIARGGKATDVQVNDSLTDPSPYTTQSECSVTVRASDGALVAVWNDSTHYYSGDSNSFVGYGYSLDGGLTWTDGGAPDPTPTFGQFSGDPDIRSDAAGNFYFSSMAGDESALGLGMMKSTDGGVTFGTPVVVHAGPADDKVLSALDTTGGLYDGNLYVCAVDMNNFSTFNLFCARSTDGGASFGSAVSICPACDYTSSQAPFPMVAPNGDVYVAFLTWPSYPDTAKIQISKSTDGGASFTLLTDPSETFPVSKYANASFVCGRPALKGPLRYNDFPSMAVDPDGVIHIAYSRHGPGSDSADVMYVRSEDNGQTWTTPVKLSDENTTTDQFFPTLLSNPLGVLVAYWYDRREDSTNVNYRIYSTRSNDGGVTWSANEAVSDVASPIYSGGDGLAECYMGDYNKGAADNDFAYIIWSDNRNMQDGHHDPDVWFDTISLAAPTTTVSTTTTTTTTTMNPTSTTIASTTTTTTQPADDDTDDTADDTQDDDWHDDDTAADDTALDDTDDDSGDDTVPIGGDNGGDSSKGGCGC